MSLQDKNGNYKNGNYLARIFENPIVYCLDYYELSDLICYNDFAQDTANGNEEITKPDNKINMNILETPMNDTLIEETNSGIKRSRAFRNVFDQTKAKGISLDFLASTHDMY